jgi:hypothetical protein
MITKFDDLGQADLFIDAVYEGGGSGNSSDDPLSKLLPGVGNQGGFRSVGRGINKKFVVLYTSGADQDWPDSLDLNTGLFVYFGDNKHPGHELHETSRGGNTLLRNVFNVIHDPSADRRSLPPFFIFQKHPTAKSSRSVQFKGLAVPGFMGLPSTADLVAIWKTSNGQRFQNYRASFTVLDVSHITRIWLDELSEGNGLSQNAPKSWTSWVQTGTYIPLVSEPTTVIRSQEEQLPRGKIRTEILKTVWEHFENSPLSFEAFAARVFQLSDQRVIIDEITRGTVDGGRDAIGRYLLGFSSDPVYVEFALEAKCYRPGIEGLKPNTIGVKEVSRLISRIRNRQFGVLVTTSIVARQAYEEVRADRHPIIFISSGDIADILIKNGFGSPVLVKNLLVAEFPCSE